MKIGRNKEQRKTWHQSIILFQFTVGKPGDAIQPDCFSILPPQGQTSSSEPSSQSSILSHTADLEIHLRHLFWFLRDLAPMKMAFLRHLDEYHANDIHEVFNEPAISTSEIVADWRMTISLVTSVAAVITSVASLPFRITSLRGRARNQIRGAVHSERREKKEGGRGGGERGGEGIGEWD